MVLGWQVNMVCLRLPASGVLLVIAFAELPCQGQIGLSHITRIHTLVPIHVFCLAEGLSKGSQPTA